MSSDPFAPHTTLGNTLSSARRALGKTLAEGEAYTRIPVRRLDALENGTYESLPAPAYVRGYIVSYAKFLDLDPAPLLEAYEQETRGSSAEESLRLPRQMVAPRSQAHHISAKTAVAVVAVLAVLAGAIWGVGRLVGGQEEPLPLPSVPEATVTPPPAVPPESGAGGPDAEATPPPAVSATDSPAPAREPFTVRVTVAQDSASWLRVTIDDLVAYEGTIAAGQTLEWTAEESAVLRIGRAPAVTVYQDGVEVDIPPGDPPTLELPVNLQ